MTSRRNPLLGPRVSISSFGPRIEHPKCGYCTEDASIPCTTCDATWYCTTKCQEGDRPVHDIICQKYINFITANPCPEDTFDKKYRLGLLLPVDSEDFELAWIANGSRGKSVATFLQYYDQDRIDTRKTLVDCNMASKDFDHCIILAVRGDFLTDNSPPNACINHIMAGDLKYPLKGPVAVVSERSGGDSGDVQHFQPCDFRILIDFLYNYDGRPKLEIGHACGGHSKGILGKRMSRFVNFLTGKAQDGKEQSTTNCSSGAEEERTCRKSGGSFFGPEWIAESESLPPRHETQHSRSSADLVSLRDDGSSLHKPESFVLPDFLPDWIRESDAIATGPITRAKTAPPVSVDTKKTLKEPASMESMEITSASPITQTFLVAKASNQIPHDDNISIRNSLDIINLYNPTRARNGHSVSSSINLARKSPSVSATTSSSRPKPTRKDKDPLTLNARNSIFSRRKFNSAEIDRDQAVSIRSITGSIMSPWTV
ncbi:0eb0a92f-c2fd-465f-8de0-6f659029a141-CDS [Sclerotinia trifoliorum]|uniref:0eb0a92f-c2fd-465f-8de0-6f659029a141-CDS n=1 Tax=Sclerotinia trifoliorum TaxID=28548 RepID=A0A8H2VVN4_9HELO|nr:0eb0a92f-c2fd-465f-8de0-6f659029a141-CDS [Sclerotinia trifoliorum]